MNVYVYTCARAMITIYILRASRHTHVHAHANVKNCNAIQQNSERTLIYRNCPKLWESWKKISQKIGNIVCYEAKERNVSNVNRNGVNLYTKKEKRKEKENKFRKYRVTYRNISTLRQMLYYIK